MPSRISVIRSLAILGGLLILSGCASASEPKVAVCDGKHRRPANPFGSVLPTTPAPEASKTPIAPDLAPSAAAPAPASPQAKPPGPRASLDPSSFEPCGEGA